MTAGHSWGHPAPTPGPGLLSKPLSDVCSPGSFSVDFLSHGLAALGTPARAGAGGDSSQGHPEATQGHPKATQGHPEGCPRLHPVEVPSPGDPLNSCAVREGQRPLRVPLVTLGTSFLPGCPLCSTCGPGGQWQCEDHACLMDGELIDAVNRGNFG